VSKQGLSQAYGSGQRQVHLGRHMGSKLLYTVMKRSVRISALVAAPAARSRTSGWTCRVALSANAAGKRFGFLWVKLNPNHTAYICTAPCSAMPPAARASRASCQTGLGRHVLAEDGGRARSATRAPDVVV
jgi:hypothetical protein